MLGAFGKSWAFVVRQCKVPQVHQGSVPRVCPACPDTPFRPSQASVMSQILKGHTPVGTRPVCAFGIARAPLLRVPSCASSASLGCVRHVCLVTHAARLSHVACCTFVSSLGCMLLVCLVTLWHSHSCRILCLGFRVLGLVLSFSRILTHIASCVVMPTASPPSPWRTMGGGHRHKTLRGSFRTSRSSDFRTGAQRRPRPDCGSRG